MLGIRRSNISNNEEGLAALIVVVMLMLVVSLLVLGYGQLARRNQQQVTDRNLSARAFYVAESGVNLAVKKMQAVPNPYASTGKTSCEPDGTILGADYKIDNATGAILSCLLIDNAPMSLEYSNIAKQTSQVVPITPASGTISNVKFSWQSTNPGTYNPCSPGISNNPPDDGSSWNCGAPLLRLDIVKTDGATLSRAGLLNSLYTAFIYPTSAAGTAAITYTPGTLGKTVTAHCAAAGTPQDCNIQVDFPGAPAGSYTARVMPLYDDMRLTVCANACAVGLRGAQAMIDSTGKAADVVRRIQVRVSLLRDSYVPNFAVQAASGLCKRYDVVPGSGNPIFAEDETGTGSASINSPCDSK